jgi:exodeoxyribonuclease VII small subunit
MKGDKQGKAGAKPERFEDLLSKAEGIVAELESGDLDLSDAVGKYHEGITVLKKCYDLIKSVEGKIQVLRLDEEGNVSLEPFQTDAAEEPK